MRDQFLPTTKSADGVKINYNKEGKSGSNVVLIHGWCCDGNYWRKTIPSLTLDHHVYTVDLAGHGKSGTNRKSWTIENYGEDVKALVDEENLSDILLIGHSMGGDVALAAAQLLGDRVRGVILVDSYHNVAPRDEQQVQERITILRENFHEIATQWINGMFTETSDPKLKEDTLSDMLDSDPSIAIPSIESAFRYSAGDAFDRIRVPVRCINRDTRGADYEAGRRRLKDFEWITMREVGHFLMLERPEEFNKILRKMILDLK